MTQNPSPFRILRFRLLALFLTTSLHHYLSHPRERSNINVYPRQPPSYDLLSPVHILLHLQDILN